VRSRWPKKDRRRLRTVSDRTLFLTLYKPNPKANRKDIVSFALRRVQIALSVCVKVMICHATEIVSSVQKTWCDVDLETVDIDWMEDGGTAGAIIAT